MGPPWREYIPLVYLAPEKFEIQGYQGSSRNWQEFGQFFYELNRDRADLPPALQAKVPGNYRWPANHRGKSSCIISLHAGKHPLCEYSTGIRGLAKL